MVIDTSAILAILQAEPERRVFIEIIERRFGPYVRRGVLCKPRLSSSRDVMLTWIAYSPARMSN